MKMNDPVSKNLVFSKLGPSSSFIEISGRFPDASFDHFFYREAEKVSCFFVKDSEEASDHRSIIFNFK